MFDVIVAGGSIAGLSAGLVLGRARRRVLICDTGQPRNAVSRGVHSFFTRDGTPPAELLRIGREQLAPYDTVELRQTRIVDVAPDGDGFVATLEDGDRAATRRLMLATGVIDDLPAVPGMAKLWGRGVYHCPYCHGWEVRDQPLAAYANGDAALHIGLLLTGWSNDVVLCTDGPATFDANGRRRLAARGVAVREEPVARLEGNEAGLERVVFTTGDAIERRALFVRPSQRQRSDLAHRLGCAFTEMGLVQADTMGQTTVPGIYVAGDAGSPAQQAIHAAAAGALAAAAINNEMLLAAQPITR